MEEKELFSYPPNTAGSENEGYFRRLNPDQRSALSAVQKWAAEKRTELGALSSHTLHQTLLLLRYLRANNFDPDLAITHLSANIKWRSDLNVDELIKLSPEEILGCSMDSITRVFPHWHCGSDLTGRPVLYKQYGKFDVTKLKAMTSMEAVMKYHIWEQEACLRLCVEQSLKTGTIIETCSAVLDVQDMKLSQVTREFLTLVKGIAAIDKDQYPETLGKLFIINVPSVFPLVWRSVQFFLDPATAAKIEIFGPRKDWLPALASQIGLENMPVTYGGVLPALSADVHPYAESMKSFNENKSNPALNRGEGVGASEGEAGGGEYALGSEENGGYPLDEVDIYINRGKAAAQQLRLQAQASALASSPRSEGMKMSPMKRILGALLPSRESKDSLKDTGVLDEDSFSSNLPRKPSSSAGTGSGTTTGTTTGTRSMRYVNNTEGSGSQDATAATVGDRWEEELQYAREFDLASPSAASKQGSGAHTRTDRFEREGEGEVETTPYVHKDILYRLCCCDTWRRVPGFLRGASAVAAVMRVITLHDFLNKRSLKQIRKYLFYAISVYMVAALTAMVVSAYLTSETLWLSTVALYVHLWTGVVVLLVSVVMIAVNLAAFIGCYYQNRAMLIMYAGMMWSGIVMFGIIAIASFLYDSYPAVSKLSSSLEGPFKDRNSVASKTVREYDLGLGGGCVMAMVLAAVPLRLAITMSHMLGKVQEKKVHPRQLRAVLRVAQCISLCAALVMLAYAGVSLHYLFRINFSPTVFAVFGLLYCGVSVILTAVSGLWVASTAHKDVVYYYYIVLLPVLTMLLLAASGISLRKLADAGKDVSEQFYSLSLPGYGKGSTIDDVQIAVDSQLLVAGVLCVFVCLFQIVSIVASRSLYRAMVKQEGEGDSWLGSGEGGHLTIQRLRERDAVLNGLATNNFSKQNVLGKLNFQNKRDAIEKYVILWALVMALFQIYFYGTYVVFSSTLKYDKGANNDFWMNSAWHKLGNADTRYVNSDPYLECMLGILAVVAGPLLLLFAWATYVRAPHRHLYGIVACTLLIYSKVLYFSIETLPDSKDLQFTADPGGTVSLIVLNIIIGILLPLLVLKREARSSIRSTSRADTQQLLLLVNTKANIRCYKEGSERNDEDSRTSHSASLPIPLSQSHSHSHSQGSFNGYVYGYGQSDTGQSPDRRGLVSGLGSGLGLGVNGGSFPGMRSRHQSVGSLSDTLQQNQNQGQGQCESAAASHKTSPSSSGLNTPKYWSPPRRHESIRKHSPLQSTLGAFRGRTVPTDRDRDVPLSLPIGTANGESYCEPPDVSDKSKDRAMDRDRDRYMRHYSRETTVTDTDTSDRQRPRSSFIDTSSTSNAGSVTGGYEAGSNEGDSSRLSIPALLRLQLRSRPIDISNKRDRSSEKRFRGRAGGGVRTQSEEEEGQYSDSERRRADSSIPSSSAKRFMNEVVRSSVSIRFNLPNPHRARPRARTRPVTDCNTSQQTPSRGRSGASSVSPEALLTALTMSMDESSSSLAMVV